MVGSVLAPMAVSLPPPPIAMLGGPEAGPRAQRHRAVYFASISVGLIALGATTAARLAAFVPPALIATLAGLALLNVVVTSIEDAVKGPLRIGPIVAFATALSDISLLGLGPIFWSLAFGTGVSWALENGGRAQLNEATDDEATTM